jgi:predicted transcriptional regulator
MTSEAVSFRLDADTLTGLDRLAAELKRCRADLIQDAVKRFVDDELAFSACIEEGERDFENGDYVTHEEIVAELRTQYAHKDAA